MNTFDSLLDVLKDSTADVRRTRNIVGATLEDGQTLIVFMCRDFPGGFALRMDHDDVLTLKDFVAKITAP